MLKLRDVPFYALGLLSSAAFAGEAHPTLISYVPEQAQTFAEGLAIVLGVMLLFAARKTFYTEVVPQLSTTWPNNAALTLAKLKMGVFVLVASVLFTVSFWDNQPLPLF